MTERATGPAGGSASGETRLARSAEREERIAYLATGFALGALETAELRELYDALREKGDAGRSAASTAWKVLGLTVDLRATLGTQLQDTVAHRVEAMATGADEQGEFVDRFRSQMGIARPRLAEVAIPGAVRRGGRIVLIAALALGAMAALALLLARRGPERIARVGLVRGTATVEGSALAPGASRTSPPFASPPRTLREPSLPPQTTTASKRHAPGSPSRSRKSVAPSARQTASRCHRKSRRAAPVAPSGRTAARPFSRAARATPSPVRDALPSLTPRTLRFAATSTARTEPASRRARPSGRPTVNAPPAATHAVPLESESPSPCGTRLAGPST
ncbi:MAG: hypothetical protein ACYS9X_08865, partial [Planctomycetota bacterium]